MGSMKGKQELKPNRKARHRRSNFFVFILGGCLCLGLVHQLGRGTKSDSATALASSLDGMQIPILAYHKIDLQAPTEWYVSAEQFARQMDVLVAYGYQTIGLDDFLRYRAGQEQPPEKPILITFDDGFQGVYQYARPILLDHQMTATFFLITSKIAESDAERMSNDWQSGEPLVYHLIWPEVQQLWQDGFTIGSHTLTHPALNQTSLETAAGEIIQSRLDIQNHLVGEPVDFFAYPYGVGSTNAGIRNLVQQAGYQAAVQYGPDDGLADLFNANLWALPRRSIERDISLVLNPEDPWWFFMRRVNPDFPLPNLSIYSLEVKDAWGSERTAFYPNEQVDIGVHVSNWGSQADVRGSLALIAPGGSIYNSQDEPSFREPVVSGLPVGSNAGVFSFTWSTPVVTLTTPVSYVLTTRDPTGLLTYFISDPVNPVTIQPAPLEITHSPQLIMLPEGVTREIIFTVQSDLPAEQMYLTVSLSHGLEVDLPRSYPRDEWKVYPNGTDIKLRGCDVPCTQSTNLIVEVGIPQYGSGEQAFVLGLRRIPGASDYEWMTYRLTMRIPNAGSDYWYLRDPRRGATDQQDYFVYWVSLLPGRLRLPFSGNRYPK